MHKFKSILIAAVACWSIYYAPDQTEPSELTINDPNPTDNKTLPDSIKNKISITLPKSWDRGAIYRINRWLDWLKNPEVSITEIQYDSEDESIIITTSDNDYPQIKIKSNHHYKLMRLITLLVIVNDFKSGLNVEKLGGEIQSEIRALESLTSSTVNIFRQWFKENPGHYKPTLFQSRFIPIDSNINKLYFNCTDLTNNPKPTSLIFGSGVYYSLAKEQYYYPNKFEYMYKNKFEHIHKHNNYLLVSASETPIEQLLDIFHDVANRLELWFFSYDNDTDPRSILKDSKKQGGLEAINNTRRAVLGCLKCLINTQQYTQTIPDFTKFTVQPTVEHKELDVPVDEKVKVQEYSWETVQSQ